MFALLHSSHNSVNCLEQRKCKPCNFHSKPALGSLRDHLLLQKSRWLIPPPGAQLPESSWEALVGPQKTLEEKNKDRGREGTRERRKEWREGKKEGREWKRAVCQSWLVLACKNQLLNFQAILWVGVWTSGSLKLAVVGVFIPRKLANATRQGLSLPRGPASWLTTSWIPNFAHTIPSFS